ncbi:hypothetical protein J6590_106203, partial [Homalodisca vitripennis]
GYTQQLVTTPHFGELNPSGDRACVKIPRFYPARIASECLGTGTLPLSFPIPFPITH